MKEELYIDGLAREWSRAYGHAVIPLLRATPLLPGISPCPLIYTSELEKRMPREVSQLLGHSFDII